MRSVRSITSADGNPLDTPFRILSALGGSGAAAAAGRFRGGSEADVPADKVDGDDSVEPCADPRVARRCASRTRSCAHSRGQRGPGRGCTAPYVDVARRLEGWIAAEVAAKGLPALSIALVDDQRIVWARGFGFADPKKRIPATAETVYRVGSVSKLFTDLAVMQLVERAGSTSMRR